MFLMGARAGRQVAADALLAVAGQLGAAQGALVERLAGRADVPEHHAPDAVFQAVKAAADVRDALLRAAARANLPVRWLPERLAEQNFNLEEPPTRASPWVAVLLAHLQARARARAPAAAAQPSSQYNAVRRRPACMLAARANGRAGQGELEQPPLRSWVNMPPCAQPRSSISMARVRWPETWLTVLRPRAVVHQRPPAKFVCHLWGRGAARAGAAAAAGGGEPAGGGGRGRRVAPRVPARGRDGAGGRRARGRRRPLHRHGPLRHEPGPAGAAARPGAGARPPCAPAPPSIPSCLVYLGDEPGPAGAAARPGAGARPPCAPAPLSTPSCLVCSGNRGFGRLRDSPGPLLPARGRHTGRPGPASPVERLVACLGAGACGRRVLLRCLRAYSCAAVPDRHSQPALQ